MDSKYRREFERWYMRTQEPEAIFERWDDQDGYEDHDIQQAWMAWQACGDFIQDSLSQIVGG